MSGPPHKRTGEPGGVSPRKCGARGNARGIRGLTAPGSPRDVEFLREYGVSRLLKRQPSAQEPAAKIAELCRRAGELLLDQADHARATLVLDKATTLAPQHPDLPQLRVRLDRLKVTQEPTEPPPPPVAVPLEPLP